MQRGTTPSIGTDRHPAFHGQELANHGLRQGQLGGAACSWQASADGCARAHLLHPLWLDQGSATHGDELAAVVQHRFGVGARVDTARTNQRHPPGDGLRHQARAAFDVAGVAQGTQPVVALREMQVIERQRAQRVDEGQGVSRGDAWLLGLFG